MINFGLFLKLSQFQLISCPVRSPDFGLIRRMGCVLSDDLLTQEQTKYQHVRRCSSYQKKTRRSIPTKNERPFRMLVMKELAIKLRTWPPSQPINKGSSACIDKRKLWREWRPSKLSITSS